MARVVAETEISVAGSRSAMAREIDVLPPPGGEASTSITPRRFRVTAFAVAGELALAAVIGFRIN
jgi:hypothetical protein